MNEEKLLTPIQYIKGVGPKRAELLKRLGVETVQDLLRLLPRRYEDRSRLKPISHVQEGETLTVMGQVAASGLQRTRTKLTIFKAAVSDGTGVIYAVFYNQPYLAEYFKNGLKVVLYGKVSRFKGRQLVMNVPEYEILEKDELNSIHIGGIVPIYPATENLNQKLIRTLVRNVLSEYINYVEETIPAGIRTRLGFVPVRTALWNIHFPDTEEIREKSMLRMVFEEFFIFQLGIAMRKHHVENFVKGISHNVQNDLIQQFEKLLLFKLTNAQEKVLGEIIKDMGSPKPMSRLLQGDVGSGKTVVAIYAILYSVGSGYQGAIMVPTEILARQHYFTIKELVEPLGIKTALLINELPKEEYALTKREISDGNVDIIVGTHALIQEDVKYKKLGLIVIDEQHKFGVMQRSLLGAKARMGLQDLHPDVLVMTATPIPRSLALTVYGDVDLSVIDELPPGRGKVVTYWITEDKLPKAYEFIRKEAAKGRQAFIVYPLINPAPARRSGIKESEKMQMRAAADMAKKLQAEEFPKIVMGLIHGRLSAEEKQYVMREFREGKIHILVATTVIEVGIDIPNATVMLVEHAERFGLAQLHQLRGRIGRGSQFSYCILQGNPGTAAGRQRLKAMEATADGFKISQEDLAIRGPGEFFGTRQHGMPELRIGNIVTDINIMETARKEALALLQNDPALEMPEYRGLYLRVKKFFGEKLEKVSV